MKNRLTGNAITLEQMDAELTRILGDVHSSIAFCAQRQVSIQAVKDFHSEVKRRIRDGDPIMVDKKTFRSLLLTQAHPERLPHIGKKQLAKAAKKVGVNNE